MIYNGFDFAPWFDTRLVTRSLLPEYEIATRDVPAARPRASCAQS